MLEDGELPLLPSFARVGSSLISLLSSVQIGALEKASEIIATV